MEIVRMRGKLLPFSQAGKDPDFPFTLPFINTKLFKIVPFRNTIEPIIELHNLKFSPLSTNRILFLL